jgi:hypothetical protein
MATVLSLFVVPVVYRIVKGWELRWHAGRGGPGAPGSTADAQETWAEPQSP